MKITGKAVGSAAHKTVVILYILLASSPKVTRSHDLFCGDDLYTGTVSNNFISKCGFQQLCHHVHDPLEKPKKSLQPELVKAGDIIFVRKFEQFFKTMHPKIKVPYIIVTSGDAHDCVRPYFLKYLNDEKIIAFFSVHPCPQPHPKFHALPLGIWQKKELFDNRREVNARLTQARSTNKTKLVYLNLDLVFKKQNYFDNRLRSSIIKSLRNKPYVWHRTRKLEFFDYIDEMAQCIFVASPQGYGPDSFRTWEALLCGCIPIVSKNPWAICPDQRKLITARDHPFQSLYENLPVLVVDNWNELSEDFLWKKLAEIRSRTYCLEKLYLEYWVHAILDVQTRFLEKYAKDRG